MNKHSYEVIAKRIVALLKKTSLNPVERSLALLLAERYLVGDNRK